MMRTDPIRMHSGYSEQSHAEDIEPWLRLAEVSQLANLQQQVLRYRVAPNSFSNSNPAASAEQFTAAAKVARQRRGMPYKDLPPPAWIDSTPRDPYDRAVELGRLAQAAGEYVQARHVGLSLLRHRPWSLRAWRLVVARRQ
jgi:hypothetical protein